MTTHSAAVPLSIQDDDRYVKTTAPRRMNMARWNVLTRMRLWQKFVLLGVLALIAVLVPFVNFYQSTQAGIDFAQEELSGIPPALGVLKIVQTMQQHRGLSNALLSGAEGQAQNRAARQAELDQLIAKLDGTLATSTDAQVREGWTKLKQDWKAISGLVAARSVDARRSFAEHTVLIRHLLVYLDTVGDHYKLTLDPNAHTYFLIQASLVHIPELTEQFGQLRGLGAGRLAEAARLRSAGTAGTADMSGVLTATDRGRFTALLEASESSGEFAFRFIDKAIRAEPRLRPLLQAELAATQDSTRQMQQLVRKEILESPALNYDSATYFRSTTDGIDLQFKLLDKASQALSAELELNVANLRRDQIITTLEILLATLLTAAIATVAVRNITGTVADLQSSVDKVRQGKFDALQAIEARDEVGDLGRTVNSLLQDRIAAQQKAEEDARRAEAENERLNNSVISILQAVNQLSQRDLTAKAPVTQDIIGTVSDSINALTDETTKVLRGVSRIAGQVELVSGNVKTQADLVSATADDERKGVATMLESLADATQSMNSVATLAEQSNRSAERATQATDTALETVRGTVKGMESIRETIAETEKRIKRLGERSQEITGIVNLINTISERTHVLALNASMQAAVAGEAGRGFAVVAEEVQRLAESSRNATQQIGTLVSNIQLETNETISTVNRTIGQVVQGSEQAQRAGEQMRITQEITGELVAQVRLIAASSEQQKATSAQLLQSVQSIGESTERTAQQITAQNQETDTLLDAARKLVESVNVFKLPAAA